MAFKSSALACVFGAIKSIGEHAPELTKTVGEGGLAALGWVYPAAILGPPLVEAVCEYIKDRENPENLAELYRNKLLDALRDCTEHCHCLTESDRSLLELWVEGLNRPIKGDPMWQSILEESLPTRMLSIDLRDASSPWPLLRAQLEQFANWFRYRRTAGTAPQGFNIPRQPLVLSPEFERYLAVNLARELLQRFRPDLASGHHRDAFNQIFLGKLHAIEADLRPLDPLIKVGELKRPKQANTALKLLDAQYRAVPFVGRTTDLNGLWHWLRSPASVSVQVVVGRGGSGKTRLAYQFLEEIESREPNLWHAGLLPHERFQDELRNQSFRRWRTRKPTLIVIDYADAAASMLEQFVIPELARCSPEQDDPPIRLLLLARTAPEDQGWYKSLHRIAGNSEEDLFPNPPVTLSEFEPEQRREVLDRMLTAAARIEPGSRIPLPSVGADPHLDKRIASPDFSDPLVLSMAAIVAHGQQSLSTLHLHRTDLARGMAKHERRRLEKLAPNDPGLLTHMAAYATLAGEMSFAEVESAAEVEDRQLRLKSQLAFARAAEILCWNGSAEPIKPDIIGEAFLFDVLREHAQHGPETVLRAVIGRPGQVTRALVRTVQDFAPDPARPSADDEACQAWALNRLTSVLATHAKAVTDGVFWEIHAALPLNTVAMILPARDFYREVSCKREPASDLVGLRALESYAIYESRAGNREAALNAIEQGVKHHRELTRPDEQGKIPEALLAGLAISLNNRANRQYEMGQRAEALESIEEAVHILSELAKKNREAFLPDLARSLNNRAAFQSGMGERAQALASIEEAVKHYRELVHKNREEFLPALGSSLNNRATFQSEMGQHADALESIKEVVKVRRELVETNRDAFLPALASSLNNQAARQGEVEQRAEALESIEEAVQIRRELVERNRDAYLPDLAMSLNNRASHQSDVGQRAEALASIEEAVTIRRKLAQKNREAFLPDLAISLKNRANLQGVMGQSAEALASIEEAVKIQRGLAERNPGAFLTELALSLGAWGGALLHAGKPAEATAKLAEGVRVITPFAEELPQAHSSLALNLASGYRIAALAAGLEPDLEYTWPLNVADEIQKQSPAPGAK